MTKGKQRFCHTGYGDRKIRYEIEGEAEESAQRLAAENPNQKYNHYLCSNCKFWHVGRKPFVFNRKQYGFSSDGAKFGASVYTFELGDRASVHLWLNDNPRVLRSRFKAAERHARRD